MLRRGIESVLKHTPPGYELIVVDNASTDGTGVYLASLDYPHLKVIHNDENKSYSVFNNQGQQLATREYILYLNDDIEAFPGWIEPLIDTLDRNPRVGAVGSRLLYPDGTVQHDGKMFKKDDLTPYHLNMGGPSPPTNRRSRSTRSRRPACSCAKSWPASRKTTCAATTKTPTCACGSSRGGTRWCYSGKAC